MNGTLREQRVHGTRSAQTALRCILFAPENTSIPSELTRSLESRDAEIVRAPSEYEALAAIMLSTQKHSTPVLILIEPDQHMNECIELARAAELYAPTARIWRHAASESPSLAAFVLPKQPTETEQVAEVRADLRSNESPYERARRESTPPSLRLVVDDPEDATAQSSASPSASSSDQHDSDGLLSEDELEMLMDPIFETKPRRGGEPR